MRTLCPGLCDIESIDGVRRSAVISEQLSKLRVSIAALQETRLAECGSIAEAEYTIYWHGGRPESPRTNGVGFAVKKSLVGSIISQSSVSDRICTIRLQIDCAYLTLICAYAPTLSSSEDAKDGFYDSLSAALSHVPTSDSLLVLGDFNARVGADCSSWPFALGHFGVGSLNSSGQRLLELCAQHSLCVTNSFFPGPVHHKVSWQHPRSKRWHQLDMVLCRRSELRMVRQTRSYHSADCDSDHSLVCCTFKLCARVMHSARPKPVPKLNIQAMSSPALCTDFADSFGRGVASRLGVSTVDDDWDVIRKCMIDSAFASFGVKPPCLNDWFAASREILSPLVDAKAAARRQFIQHSTAASREHLRTARAELQRAARHSANSYWQDLCQSIQDASDRGDARAMYHGLKVVFGPRISKVAPLQSLSGELLTSRSEQMGRWVEHYLELYSKDSTVAPAVFGALPKLPARCELDLEPSPAELQAAIDALHCGTSPGADGIPAELLKSCKAVLLPQLHSLLLRCWREGTVPHGMRDATIVTLYKGKGDRSNCDSYRGVSLLSVTGKAFARVVLARLQRLADTVYPETQCGFRSGRSTVDMIFCLRQLQEKCREQQRPLHIAFVDLTKAFDTVSRHGLYMLLQHIGCPPKLLAMVMSFHEDMYGQVLFDGNLSDRFPIRRGVKQGCTLAPTLFGIYFSLLLKYAFDGDVEGIFLYSRADGKLFNLARLRSRTRCSLVQLRDFLFADDAALVAHDASRLQLLLDRFDRACIDFGLSISLKKTVVLSQGANAPLVTLRNTPLLNVSQFCYLGSTVAASCSLDAEIDIRLGKAATAFGLLSKRAWSNNKLTLNTKVAIYKSCVLSCLLYGSESWTTYRRQEKKLNTFHFRCLRKLMGVTWRDKVSNEKVLQVCKIPTLLSVIKQRRLRWLGHVQRMSDGRLPKSILYGELATGKRHQGRPKLRFTDVCKRDMADFGICCDAWESASSNRSKWRSALQMGVGVCDSQYLETYRGHNSASNVQASSRSADVGSSYFSCPHCNRVCLSRIGLFSHVRKCSNPTTRVSGSSRRGR